MQPPASGCVDHAQWSLESKRDVNPVSVGDESSCELSRATLEGPEVAVPVLEWLFPEDGPVEGVPGDKFPVGRQLDRDSRPLVHDVEQSATAGDHGAHACHAIVVPRPSRAADPLHVARRADLGVVGHRIATGVMQVMGPVVDVARTGFLVTRPPGGRTCHQDALGSENPEHLGARDLLGVVDDQQICQSINKWQFTAGQSTCGHMPINTPFEQVFSGGIDPGGITIQSVHLVPRVDSQSTGEFAFPAAKVNHQAALNSGLLDDIGGVGGDGCRKKVA